MIRSKMSTSLSDIIGSRTARDRRGNSRFPVNEDVWYKTLSVRGPHQGGIGRTLNISSGGILFTTEDRLALGRLLEVSVAWPAKLGGSCRLKLVAVGRVVRADAAAAAIRIQRYEFRTCRSAECQ
jgi:hypothetical protein